MKFSTAASRIFASALLATILLAACGAKSSDEQQVREVFAGVEKAAEDRDTSDVLEFVAADYADKQGLDKTQLQNFLRGYFLSHPKLEIVLGVDSLEFPAEGLAQARINVKAVELDQLSNSDSATLEVELRKVDGAWRVTRADRATQ
jgi:hypothetical protein